MYLELGVRRCVEVHNREHVSWKLQICHPIRKFWPLGQSLEPDESSFTFHRISLISLVILSANVQLNLPSGLVFLKRTNMLYILSYASDMPRPSRS